MSPPSAVEGIPITSCSSAPSRKSDDDKVEDPTQPLVDVNSKGLLTLPLELHLEILAHLDCQSIPWITREARGDRDRFNAIHALSSTCRTLYDMYSPLCWRRVEARGWRRPCECNTWYTAQDLRAYCRVLTQMPHRAELVQYVYSMR